MSKTQEGKVVDADGNPVHWQLDDGSCPSCGSDEKRHGKTLGGIHVCEECGHEWRKS